MEKELEIHTREKILVPKDDPEDNKGIQIRESRKQKQGRNQYGQYTVFSLF
jgi:hypothetical protein